MSDKNNKIESEIDFLAVLKNPLRMFGAIYIYFLLVGLAIGVYFVWNMDHVSFNKLQGSYLDSVAVVKDIPIKVGGLKPAVDLNLIQSSTPEQLAKGKELYDAQCMSCHGTEGNGDGPAGVALNPKARDFHSVDGWTNGRTFTEMYKTLQEGIIQNGMSPYDYIPAEDRIAIINYIRTLTEFPTITDQEVVDLDTKYQLSKGVMESNTIPVEMAVRKIVNEENAVTENIVLKDADSQGAKLLEEYSINSLRAVKLFVLNSNNEPTLSDFIIVVSNDPSASGFNPSVVTISESEWNLIYTYLKSYKV